MTRLHIKGRYDPLLEDDDLVPPHSEVVVLGEEVGRGLLGALAGHDVHCDGGGHTGQPENRHCIVLYCILLCCVVLYCIVLCCIV